MNEALSLARFSIRARLLIHQLPRGASSISARYASSIAGSNTTSSASKSEGHVKQPSVSSNSSPLSNLPLSHLIRSWLIMSMSSSDIILKTTMSGMQKMVHSKSILFDPSRNRALNWLFRRTFYDQFCAGENKNEIHETIKSLNKIGFDGIILEYASEVLEDADSLTASKIEKDIEYWKSGMLSTIDMVNKGDFIGLKWSGMGPESLRLLKEDKSPSSSMATAMTEVCDAAYAKGVRLLPAAEPQNANRAVDAWSIDLASKYNRLKTNTAVVYNTYQCYLKSTPETLARHLSHAAENDYTLGVKLVRGAYLETEQRDLIWDTKQETDDVYDSIAKSLLEKKYSDVLKPSDPANAKFPNVNVMIATHNEDSVLKAHDAIAGMSREDRAAVQVDYAQLQGMADEISCKLLQVQKSVPPDENFNSKLYKCLSWGTTMECLHYLLRRAAENRDAFSRTVHTRKAMGSELLRRFRKTFLRIG